MINMKNDLLVQSNELIEAKYKYTKIEAKIIYSFIQLIEKEQSDFWTYTIPTKDIADYREIKKNCKSIMSKPIIIENGESKDNWIVFNWFADIEYKNGFIEASFSKKLKPYLLNLKKNLTTFGLKNILNLTSQYSIRLYQIFKMQQFKVIYEIELEKLTTMLQVPKTYKLFKHFKQKVLDISIPEINKNTDIFVSYTAKKERRKIKSILFTIQKDDQQNFVNQIRDKYKNGKDIILFTTEENIQYILNTNGHIEKKGGEKHELLSPELAKDFWSFLYEKSKKEKLIFSV